MSVTIAINGLTICHKGSGGMHMNTAPDVCKTPDKAIPIPYTITSTNADLVKGTTTVKADGGQMVATKPSEFAKCTGDEAGSMGGVVSGTNLKQSNWITYSPNVYAEGQNICRLSDKLFMNNRNTISGNTGQREGLLGTGDPVLDALCEIFCEAREEWQQCRGKPGCTRPSTRAKRKVESALADNASPLSRAMARRYPGMFGAAEKSFYAVLDGLEESARKLYTQSGLKDALRRAVRRAAGNVVLDRAGRAAGRIWLRAVPFLGLAVTALDVYMTAQDVLDLIDAADDLFDNAVRVQPDFAVVNPEDGSVEQVYDFKFDAPGYQDEWGDDQEELYNSLSGNREDNQAVAVDNATCDCDRRRPGPSAAVG